MALLFRNMLPFILVSFILAEGHSLQAQTFVDGDPAGVLNTAPVGGYLGHGVSFVDFNGDGFDDLCFAQFEGQILAYEGDGETEVVKTVFIEIDKAHAMPEVASHVCRIKYPSRVPIDKSLRLKRMIFRKDK